MVLFTSFLFPNDFYFSNNFKLTMEPVLRNYRNETMGRGEKKKSIVIKEQKKIQNMKMRQVDTMILLICIASSYSGEL